MNSLAKYLLVAVAALLTIGEGAAQRSLPITRHKAGGIVRNDTIAIARDTSSQRYDYVEALKLLHISRDTVRGYALLREMIERDSSYAPAHHTLASSAMRHNPTMALHHAERAYRSDTTSLWYAKSYGEALVQNRMVEQAIEQYRRIVELEPKNPENYYVLAWLCSRTGKYDEGIELITTAETRFGRIDALAELKLFMLYHTGQTLLAEQEARRAYEENPSEDNMERLGEMYAANKKDSLTERLYIEAVQRDSLSVRNLLRLGEYYYQRKQMAPYTKVMVRIIALPEWDFEMKYKAVKALVDDNQMYYNHIFDIAQMILSLYKQYPEKPEAVDLLGSHYIYMSDIESSLDLFKRHLTDEPPREAYFLAVIDIHNYLKQYDSVALYTQRAIEVFPSSPTLHLHRGATLQTKGDLMGCLRSFERAEQMATNDTLRGEILGYIGDVYHSIRERREALERAGLRRDTSRYPVKMSAAKARQKSYAYYEKALLYYYDNAAVLNNYAYFLSLEGEQLERAEKMAQRAVELSRNASNIDTYAWILHLRGEHAEAQRLMRQALALDNGESADLQMHYGDILYALENYALAKSYWQRALQYGADPEAVEFRLSLLEREVKPKMQYNKER